MIYMDYCATTPTNKEVLDTFNKVSTKYIGNPNSLHKLGVEAEELISASTNQIKKILNIEDKEVIYTSGSSESNNLAIKGIAYQYRNRGKHIITTRIEHSSIISPLSFLQEEGFEVDFVNITDEGLVDLEHLKTILRDDTILVSVSAVDSEIGLKQPIKEITEILKNYSKCFFHVDATQAIGKIKMDLKEIDLISFSAHKFYGIKGIGVLIKNSNLRITPLIHGGKSTTNYRSGTPPLALIASISKALKLAYEDIDIKNKKINMISEKIKEGLSNYEGVVINSRENSLPNVINFSLININPETFLHALEEDEIYISTKSACSSKNSISKSVYALTKNKDIASKTLRISISHLTNDTEVKNFLQSFEKNYRRYSL